MSASDEPQAKILVVDDDADVRELLLLVLERTGFDVYEAPSGEHALLQLQAHPDTVLVLLDWMMPGMDGLDVLEEIQLMEMPPPVLMLTAKSAPEDMQLALEMGAVDYLKKPVSRETLLFKIDNILCRNRDHARNLAARRRPISLKARVPLTILSMNETGCTLQSSFALPKDAMVFLESSELSHRLDIPRGTRTAVRITHAHGRGNLHRLEGEFVGMQPQVLRKLREAIRLGEI